MKFPGQIKDGVIDNLLRAYVSRPGNPHQLGVDFDPDQANAYLERRLNASERSHYEQHLSECATCRKSIVALARMVQSDPVATGGIVAAPPAGWLEGARQVLGVLARPQWAIAAAAAVVMAISLPFILSNKKDTAVFRQAESVAPASAAPGSPVVAEKVSPARPDSSAEFGKNAQPQVSDGLIALHQNPQSAQNNEAQRRASGGDSKALNDAAAQKETDSTKQQAKETGTSKDDSKSNAVGVVSQNAPVTAPESGARDAENRQQQTEKEKATEPPTKPVPADAVAENQKRERAEEVAPPPAAAAPAPSAELAKERSGLKKSPAKLSFGSVGSTESVRATERKVNGKRFVFKDGAWTDKEFDPDKDLPLVMIVRDSNVYKEVIGKRPGLKPYLAGFSPTDRAIIVYKGTVYKLIPQ